MADQSYLKQHFVKWKYFVRWKKRGNFDFQVEGLVQNYFLVQNKINANYVVLRMDDSQQKAEEGELRIQGQDPQCHMDDDQYWFEKEKQTH